MKPTRNWTLTIIMLLVLAAGVFIASRQTKIAHDARPQTERYDVMGTVCTLTAVPGRTGAGMVDTALQAGYQELLWVDRSLSLFRPDSELSRLNAAPVGELISLSPRLADLLHDSLRLTEETRGAFDPTAKPLFRLWVSLAEQQRLPTDDELLTTANIVGWDKFILDGRHAGRTTSRVTIDLNAIAAGFAADLAANAMKNAGMEGGMADAGGEIVVFGTPPSGAEHWRIGIRHPFRRGTLCGVLALKDAAISTSGNYEKFITIDSRRYSHIVDPRTGLPVDSAPSVTVIAPNATAADAWSTALSVLGPEGMKIIETMPGYEAMMVIGDPESPTILTTPGFDKLLLEPIQLN